MNSQNNMREISAMGLSYSDKKKLSQYENLIKKLLFVCEKCDGALVQLATCTYCKKTVMRVCVYCNTISRIPHASCNHIGISKSTKDSVSGVQTQ